MGEALTMLALGMEFRSPAPLSYQAPWWLSCNLSVQERKKGNPGTSWLAELAKLVNSKLSISIYGEEQLRKTPNFNLWVFTGTGTHALCT